ncbi:MAG TPA: hypothetical protein PK076_05170 [Saprospiraceae bacterium]|nr:hypothetical protein [Saprospiraceae bacterium]HQW55492.1 hypothetical protein [Saprospiraceae bacterium]
MSNTLLLPNKFKLIGWFLLIVAVILFVASSVEVFDLFPEKSKVFAIFNKEIFGQSQFFTLFETNITLTVVGVLFIIGAMMVGFSKEKREDEFIAKLRLSSLLWAVWVNYALLFLAFFFVYGTDFLTVMMYNMFTILIIFIVRFNYLLYKNSKVVLDEE